MTSLTRDGSSSVKSIALVDDAVQVGTSRSGTQAEAPKIWTKSAKLFIASISLFVISTVALLAALEGINVMTTYSNHVLLPQSIASELVLLVAGIFAVRSKNMVQIFAVVLFNIFLVICGFIEAQQQHPRLVTVLRDMQYYTSSRSYEEPLTRARLALIWTIPCVDLLFHAGCDFYAWKLYLELGWDAYKRVSGNLHLSKLYFNYQLLCSSLLFTLYFSAVQTWSFCFILLATWTP
ncbi:hypothetical protein BDY24DRAFT_435471, partial [Mrakia frigida]|uniref:uncharacterized protein n=1 Tax=Mrakia frigida TaxID=29902 RepID=UPI003FCBFDB4